MSKFHSKYIGTVAVIATLGLTTACSNTGQTRETDKNAVTVVAAIGGVLAANALGVDNNVAKVAIGALTGYTARSVFEQVNKDTANDPNTDVEAVKIGDQEFVQINVKNVNFRSGSAELDPYELSRIAPVLNTLKDHPATKVHIEGHTDSDGTQGYNQQLSENRAKNIAFYLMDNGITRDRIKTYGYGEERPIASNATPEGKQQNRRVTFLISEI
ncbi:MAG: OmpA family protein [Thiomicrorhabdus sp.]|nr:OmpA family protein [Thiomicrorhabdus sp.]